MTKREVREEVRKRSRFQCEAPEHLPVGEIIEHQYAHIVPESKEGAYSVSNILFLCYDHHRQYEAEGLNGRQYQNALIRMRGMRDTPKVDNIMSGVFGELLLDKDSQVEVHFGADKYIATPEIFSEQSMDGNVRSYIAFWQSDGKIIIDGLLKDEIGKPLLTFNNSRLTVFSGDLWDIERKPRSLKIINLTRKIWFHLYQEKASEAIIFTGALFVGGRSLSVTKDEVKIGDGIRMTGNIFINNPCGMSLPTNTPWRPIGHMRPGLSLSLNLPWLK